MASDQQAGAAMGTRKRALDESTNQPPPTRGKKRGGGKNVARRGVAEKVDIPGIFFSKSDSAPQLTLSKDFKEVTGEKGYRTARAVEGVAHGYWYWECEILDYEKPEGHCRLGWSQKQGDLQAPVGYDRFSYAYRDLQGSRVHQSMRDDEYGEPYGPGDVIGFAVCLPEMPEHLQEAMVVSFDNSPSSSLASPNLSKVGQALSEDEQKALISSVMELGNHIRFYRNGVDQGVAYDHIPPARYYPAVSLYMGAKIRANFGPRWICDPVDYGCQIAYKPISELREPLKKEDMKAYNDMIKHRKLEWRQRHRARRPPSPLDLSSSNPQPPLPGKEENADPMATTNAEAEVDTEGATPNQESDPSPSLEEMEVEVGEEEKPIADGDSNETEDNNAMEVEVEPEAESDPQATETEQQAGGTEAPAAPASSEGEEGEVKAPASPEGIEGEVKEPPAIVAEEVENEYREDEPWVVGEEDEDEE